MCFTIVASILVSATPCPAELASTPKTAAATTRTQAVRLSDPQLQRVRGGRGLTSRPGREGLQRLMQDTSFRDFAIMQPTTSQQMDNWWTDIGAGLIAASLFQ